MKLAGKTDVGRVRQDNQDDYRAGELPGDAAWLLVCDGMGGARGGREASQSACDVIERCCFYFGEIYKDCMWSGVRLVRQWLRDSVENKHAHPEQNTEALYDLYLALEKILSTHQGEGKGELRSDVPKTILCRILVSHFIGVITVWCMLNASFDLAKDSENYLKLDIENLLGPYVEK